MSRGSPRCEPMACRALVSKTKSTIPKVWVGGKTQSDTCDALATSRRQEARSRGRRVQTRCRRGARALARRVRPNGHLAWHNAAIIFGYILNIIYNCSSHRMGALLIIMPSTQTTRRSSILTLRRAVWVAPLPYIIISSLPSFFPSVVYYVSQVEVGMHVTGIASMRTHGMQSPKRHTHGGRCNARAPIPQTSNRHTGIYHNTHEDTADTDHGAGPLRARGGAGSAPSER